MYRLFFLNQPIWELRDDGIVADDYLGVELEDFSSAIWIWSDWQNDTQS